MAKKGSSSGESTEKVSVFDLIKKFDDSAEVLSDSKIATIKEYISTGNYMLNACISGSIFKGVCSGRVLCLSGDPQTGKSYLAVSICREAQKMGYTPIYMDSEGAIDTDFVLRLGCKCDKNKKDFIIKPVTTVSEVSTFMTNTLKSLMETPEDKRPKIIFVLDSLGNLTSNKELNDILEATGKKDMQRAQDIKALFRTVATSLAKTQTPMIVCTHTYSTQDLYAKKIVTGGCLVEGEEIVTIDGAKPINKIEIGEFVLTADGVYKEVLETFSYNKPTIKFKFSNGKEIECSPEHKFLIGEDPNDEKCWKKAKDLNENDFIYEMVSGTL